jgi:hypothetical protein
LTFYIRRLEVTRKFGALPPPGVEWQIGKTAASISFVNDAERYIVGCNNADEIERLKKAAQEVKEGKRVLDQWLTVEEFLARDGGAS